MNELLFRGKQKTWIYGGVAINGDEATIYESHEGGVNIPFSVDKESVGQFIGVYDKKGVRVFEGDFLEFIHYDSNRKKVKEIGRIYCSRFGSFWVDTKYSCESTSVIKYGKVIGNITDNPELDFRDELPF